MSLAMPAPIPVSNEDVERQRMESDLDRTLDSLSDEEFDSSHTFSRLGGFGRDSKSTLQFQSTRNHQYLAPFESDTSALGAALDVTRGAESSFDAHAKRSGLSVPLRSATNPISRHHGTPDTSSISLEFGRNAPVTGLDDSLHGGARDHHMDDFDKSLFVGSSPVSTIGHHASRVTLGAGIFSNKGPVMDSQSEEEEYDPDRAMERLIAAAKSSKSNGKVTSENDATADQYKPRRSIFEPAAPKGSHHHLYRPSQPSPLQSQINSRSVSASASLPDKHQKAKSQSAMQASRARSPLNAADNRQNVSSQRIDLRPSGNKTSQRLYEFAERDQENAPAPKIRVVSATTATESRPEESYNQSRASLKGGLGDLTSLTGLLGTPKRGIFHHKIGEDGEKIDGANLDSALRQMENDMKSLKLETEQSRARIRDLELEVEKARIAAMKAQSDADGDRVKQAEAQRRIELLESEKSDLEAYIKRFKGDYSKLESNLAKEMGRVNQVRQEIVSRSPSRSSNPMVTPIPLATNIEDLVPLVNHLAKKVNGLETDVAQLKSALEDVHERTLGDISVAPQPKTQYAKGVQTAAYEGAVNANAACPMSTRAMPVSTQDLDGDSSPSPSSRSNKSRHRSSRRQNIHDSRSEEPQEDPAASPFPAIRGDKLEREFFSPSNPKVGDRLPRQPALSKAPGDGRDLRARVEEDDDEVDEGYGGEETHEAAAPTPALKKATKSSSSRRVSSQHPRERVIGGDRSVVEMQHELDGGRVPPQTNVIKVLRELEEDYRHYLSIYTDLAEQYRRMSPLSTKRNVLAEHLKEVIDTMEQKANQVACLTEVLEVRDKPYMAPMLKAARASKLRTSVPETIRAIRKDLGRSAVNTPGRQASQPATARSGRSARV